MLNRFTKVTIYLIFVTVGSGDILTWVNSNFDRYIQTVQPRQVDPNIIPEIPRSFLTPCPLRPQGTVTHQFTGYVNPDGSVSVAIPTPLVGQPVAVPTALIPTAPIPTAPIPTVPTPTAPTPTLRLAAVNPVQPMPQSSQKAISSSVQQIQSVPTYDMNKKMTQYQPAAESKVKKKATAADSKKVEVPKKNPTALSAQGNANPDDDSVTQSMYDQVLEEEWSLGEFDQVVNVDHPADISDIVSKDCFIANMPAETDSEKESNEIKKSLSTMLTSLSDSSPAINDNNFNADFMDELGKIYESDSDAFKEISQLKPIGGYGDEVNYNSLMNITDAEMKDDDPVILDKDALVQIVANISEKESLKRPHNGQEVARAQQKQVKMDKKGETTDHDTLRHILNLKPKVVKGKSEPRSPPPVTRVTDIYFRPKSVMFNVRNKQLCAGGNVFVQRCQTANLEMLAAVATANTIPLPANSPIASINSKPALSGFEKSNREIILQEDKVVPHISDDKRNDSTLVAKPLEVNKRNMDQVDALESYRKMSRYQVEDVQKCKHAGRRYT